MTHDPLEKVIDATKRAGATRSVQREADSHDDPRRPPLLLRVLLFGVPAAIAVVMVSVLVGAPARVDVELQLQTSREVLPGSTLAVRGLFFTRLQAIEGPQLSPTQAQVEVLDPSQQVLATHPTRLGLGDTLEAQVPIDSSWRGPLTLRLSTRLDDTTVRVEQPCIVTEGATALEAHPRALRHLQQFSEGPIRPEPGAVAPSSLDVRVRGGACSPEMPCELLLHVGEPAAVIEVQHYGALEVITPPPTEPTADVVAFSVRVHGPEAELRIVAHVEGALVARRSFRLPVAQAMLPIALPQVLIAADATLPFERPGGEAPCIVDLFHDERWVESTTFERCDRGVLSTKASPGLWRVQTRDDAFGGDAGATRFFYVRDAGESDADVLIALARSARGARGDDAMARRVLERPALFAERDASGYAAWLLASLDDRVVELPPPTSSFPRALADLDRKRTQLRIYALVALLLTAIAAVSLVARRGLRASARARDILGEAGDEEAHSEGRRVRMTLTVIASAALIGIAFLVIALYVIARG